MWYKQTFYKKDKQGKWVKTHTTEPIKCYMDYGRWRQSCVLDEKNGDKTYLKSVPTNSGLNRKVLCATTYFAGGKEKSKCELITTSNKIPKSYYKKNNK